MNISSVVLHALPQHHPALLARLGAVEGVEVHATSPEGRMVLTLEGPNVDTVADTYTKLQGIEGVLSVSLVYQYSDDTLDTECDSEEAEK